MRSWHQIVPQVLIDLHTRTTLLAFFYQWKGKHDNTYMLGYIIWFTISLPVDATTHTAVHVVAPNACYKVGL